MHLNQLPTFLPIVRIRTISGISLLYTISIDTSPLDDTIASKTQASPSKVLYVVAKQVGDYPYARSTTHAQQQRFQLIINSTPPLRHFFAGLRVLYTLPIVCLAQVLGVQEVSSSESILHSCALARLQLLHIRAYSIADNL